MLKELMYTSCVAAEFTDTDLEKLLQQSRVNNLHNKVSGVLLYDGRAFMQILEGEEQALDELFDLIKNDKRHFNVTMESYANIKNRTFENWIMKSIRVPIMTATPCAA